MEKKVKSVLKIGNSLGISLSELKDLGIKRGDSVTAYIEDGKITICDSDYLEALRPIGIEQDVWDRFVSTVISSKRLKKLKREDRIKEAINEALKKWIEEEEHLVVKIKV